MKNKLFLLLIFSLIAIYGCAQLGSTVEEKVQEPAEVDIVEETTKAKVTEEKEGIEEETQEGKISAEVKELLSLADEKVQSIRYKYKGPETKDFFYEFFVKENKVKYILDSTFKTLDIDDAYDVIYINTEAKTALAYCDNRKCRVKGKKSVLNYDEAYIWTPFDWLDNIEFAEKTGEELIGQRSTWKLETNIGTLWIGTFFGVPLQAELEDNKYQFVQMKFNGVKDEDVTPS